jgi:hypothetical protein
MIWSSRKTRADIETCASTKHSQIAKQKQTLLITDHTNPSDISTLLGFSSHFRNVRIRVDAVAAWSTADFLWLVTGIVALILDTNVIDIRHFDVGESRGVAVVGVNTNDLGSARGSEVVDDDMAFIHVVAVAAATVHFAEALNSKAGDR